MLTVQDFTKTYGQHRAVNNLSFTVPDGAVTGFLGPNGSGKSTTMRMAMGLEQPDSGLALFDGQPISAAKKPAEVAGALLDATWFHPGRSALSHLRILADLQKVSYTQVDEVLEAVGIAKVAGKRVGGYSLGMKQRLGLACALLSQPTHLLLDEPVNGLDPAGVHWMRDRIRHYADNGVAVLVSSHLLSEMQLTADRLVVIGKGKLLAEGTMEEFVGAGQGVEVGVDKPEILLAALHAGGYVATRDGDLMRVNGVEPAAVGAIAAAHGLVITHLTRTKHSLEDAFLAATHESLEYHTA